MILDEILIKTRYDLEKRKKDLPFDLLGRSLASNVYIPRDVIKALTTNLDDPFKIIAEIKKASPSKGVIRENFSPVDIAVEYQKGGANAFSILTEPHFFQGNLEYLSEVRHYSNLPILRKDFIIDEYQILESLVYGADFILLIAKVLSQKELKRLLDFARRLGLEALVETHDARDVKNAIFAGADIIGINHRDLQTFDMHMDLTQKLIPLIPNNKIIVAESGLKDNLQLRELNKIGVDAFLIGETFMRQDDVCMAVKKMKGDI
ncbi:indole-3-glycerol phosphate synthase TrpC [Campylobacter sp. FMV-PI01]|uniref:Indole-3-glycerol phosphate synthase n=1 Tax=Campylobacter portucalensis TaxID=2608384 RepID=A0A6L5WJ06_9BACT|nr:indole-3-glycerol phosphate synthase TrpC [Campylobacter portucalensis]MSN97014.1 indole-3-glycerol phosphate synthase TrpC [Campylobacter portucalensis]